MHAPWLRLARARASWLSLLPALLSDPHTVPDFLLTHSCSSRSE
ncbi:hypothetical protein ACIBHX_44150 [Nonomuraea sp. NPDC050536]